MCYEFKLDRIHIGFADYAAVVFSGNLNDLENVIFLRQIASTSPKSAKE